MQKLTLRWQGKDNVGEGTGEKDDHEAGNHNLVSLYSKLMLAS
jgi:hypothetical protein